MKKFSLCTVILLMLALFSLQIITSIAQENEVKTMMVSGTFDYTPEILVWEDVDGKSFAETTEVEVWIGDIDGTGFSEDRIIISPDGTWEGWILTTFDEVQIGDMSGGLVMISIWTRPSPTAHWQGEWIILRGSGDLVNLHGRGKAWGPGFNPEDPEASPDIFYSGQLTFLNPEV